jgi:hypothetical protein
MKEKNRNANTTGEAIPFADVFKPFPIDNVRGAVSGYFEGLHDEAGLINRIGNGVGGHAVLCQYDRTTYLNLLDIDALDRRQRLLDSLHAMTATHPIDGNLEFFPTHVML